MKEDNKRIRIFAIGIGVIFQFFTFVSWYRGGGLYPYLSAFGIIFATFGLSFPERMKPLYTRWMKIAAAIGRFQTKLLLVLLFYLVITPISAVLKLMRKDILDMKLDSNAKTHWKKRAPMQEKKGFFKQF